MFNLNVFFPLNIVFFFRLMEKTLTPTNSSKIRVQDYSTLFTSVLDSNYEGLSVLLEFLKNNYQELPN